MRPALRSRPQRKADTLALLRTKAPHSAGWLDRIEAPFTALRHFWLADTHHEEPRGPRLLEPALPRLAQPARAGANAA